MTFNSNQRLALAFIPKVSSILSLFGSFWIVVEVITDNTSRGKPKRKLPYHRLLLAMSIYDILESIWNFMSTWPIPKDTDSIAWTAGTDATCSAQGFFLTLGVAVPIYNAMLSLYYLLTINFHYTESKIAKRLEPCMHLFAFLWAFLTAIVAVSLRMMKPSDLWCWIGSGEVVFRMVFYFIPLWFCIFFASVCTLLVYSHVREVDESTLKYRRPNSWWARLSNLQPNIEPPPDLSEPMEDDIEETRKVNAEGNSSSSNFDTTESFVGDNNISAAVQKFMSIPQVLLDEDIEQPRNVNEGEGVGDSNDDNDQEQNITPQQKQSGEKVSSVTTTTSSDTTAIDVGLACVEPPPIDRAVSAPVKSSRASLPASVKNNKKKLFGGGKLRRSQSTGRMFTLAKQLSIGELRGSIKRWKIERRNFAKRHPRTIEVFHQACFYLGAFYLTHIWSTMNRIIQASGGTAPFMMVFLQAFFDPLQGFLNFSVYLRPKYLRLKKENPELGRLELCLMVLTFTNPASTWFSK